MVNYSTFQRKPCSLDFQKEEIDVCVCTFISYETGNTVIMRLATNLFVVYQFYHLIKSKKTLSSTLKTTTEVNIYIFKQI